MQISLLAPQALVGFIDALAYMAVAPSIIFYVLELGGTKDQYGIILSAFSFASFCSKPFLVNAIADHCILSLFSMTDFASPLFQNEGLLV